MLRIVKIAQLYCVLCALLTALLGVLAACAETQDEDTLVNYSRTARLNYERGMEDFEDEDCADARKLFEHVQSRFPYSRYAALAQLRLADCDYVQDKYSEAAVSYKHFVKTHPAHPDVHYAAFRTGLSYYRMIPHDWFIMPPSWERDQSATRDAVRSFKLFMRNYPKSRHIKWARELLSECERALARHEIYAAEFYRNQGDLKAAAGRLHAAMQRYPDSILAPEALYLLGITYLELQWYTSARYTFETLVSKYPESHQSSRARVYLETVMGHNTQSLQRGSDG